jgi:hypothetical protein
MFEVGEKLLKASDTAASNSLLGTLLCWFQRVSD